MATSEGVDVDERRSAADCWAFCNRPKQKPANAPVMLVQRAETAGNGEWSPVGGLHIPPPPTGSHCIELFTITTPALPRVTRGAQDRYLIDRDIVSNGMENGLQGGVRFKCFL